MQTRSRWDARLKVGAVFPRYFSLCFSPGRIGGLGRFCGHVLGLEYHGEFDCAKVWRFFRR